MSNDVSDLRSTIIPKSDQLNAEQLLGGPMTVTVSDVRLGSDDQPVVIHYANDAGRPYKPCKTMRKVLIFAWGEDGRKWVGRSMTLFNDQSVKFGGLEVGGIRISHMTDIARDVQVSLTATKGKKALHTIKWMPNPTALDTDGIESAATIDELRAVFGAAYKATRDASKRALLKAAYDQRASELAKPLPLEDRIAACTTLSALQELSDEAETLPESPERDAVMAALLARDKTLAEAGVTE